MDFSKGIHRLTIDAGLRSLTLHVEIVPGEGIVGEGGSSTGSGNPGRSREVADHWGCSYRKLGE